IRAHTQRCGRRPRGLLGGGEGPHGLAGCRCVRSRSTQSKQHEWKRQMTRAHRWIGRSLLALTASIGLASCAVSDPTQFYALSRAAAPRPLPASASIAMSRVDGTGIAGIGVGPVIVPGYLDRTQIVIRTGTDQ